MVGATVASWLHGVGMGLIIRLLELLIVLVPLAGVLYGGWRALTAALLAVLVIFNL